MFRWVSCPHYLGEVVIYAGLAITTRGAPLSLMVLTWVVRIAIFVDCTIAVITFMCYLTQCVANYTQPDRGQSALATSHA